MLYYFVSCMAINTVTYDIYYSMILYMHYEGTYVISYTSIICMILSIYIVVADDVMHSEIASMLMWQRIKYI